MESSQNSSKEEEFKFQDNFDFDKRSQDLKIFSDFNYKSD